MLAWDKIYIYIKELLEHKNLSAHSLWSIAQGMSNPAARIPFLKLWRIEIHHTIKLNKLLQSLGYNQIRPSKNDIIRYPNILEAIEENISQREKWLPVLEKITEEIFGNDIYYTFMEIMADDLINLEILKDLLKQTQLNQ
ncbi:MAG: hypothetical protein GXW85_05895 [Clostridia bacterium]|nr:hypothetical protein [Clostridia bacterium]